jgi:hypothetical protein
LTIWDRSPRRQETSLPFAAKLRLVAIEGGGEVTGAGEETLPGLSEPQTKIRNILRLAGDGQHPIADVTPLLAHGVKAVGSPAGGRYAEVGASLWAPPRRRRCRTQ